MRLLFILALSLAVSSCASTTSNKMLNASQENLRSIFSGNIYLDAKLINSNKDEKNQNNSNIKENAVKKANYYCKEPYLNGLEKKLEGLIRSPSADAPSIFFSSVDKFEKDMDICLEKYGLTGNLAVSYKNSVYSFPDYLKETIPSGIDEVSHYLDAKNKVKKERQENASLIIGAVALAGAAAMASSDDYSGYSVYPGTFDGVDKFSVINIHKIILHKGFRQSYLVEVPDCFVTSSSSIIPYENKLLIDGRLCDVRKSFIY